MSALEEWGKVREETWDLAPRLARKMDAAIAELEAENERLRGANAELETDRLLDMDQGYYRKLEAESERLKVCGNCTACSAEVTFTDHEYRADGFHHECGTPYTIADDGTESQVEWAAVFAFVEMGDSCHFTPSRWADRSTS